MKLRPILLGLCVLLLGLVAMPVVVLAQTSDFTEVAGEEREWRRMTPQRFPGTEASWRRQCAKYVAVGFYTAAWCNQIVGDYLAFKATGSSTVCEATVSRPVDRFRAGMVGDISTPTPVPNLVQRIAHDIALTRCTRDGESAIFIDEPGTGCNNLHVPELVVPVKVSTPPQECRLTEAVTVTPRRIIVSPPLIANGTINLSGSTVVLPETRTTGVELTACTQQ